MDSPFLQLIQYGRRVKTRKEQVERTTIDERIASRAYELWLQEGCPDGQDTRHWLEAERQLKSETTFTDTHPEESD